MYDAFELDDSFVLIMEYIDDVAMSRLSEDVVVIEDDIEDILGQVLQYLYSGDYTVLIPAAHDSSHVACEDEFDTATEKLLPLKQNIFIDHESQQKWMAF